MPPTRIRSLRTFLPVITDEAFHPATRSNSIVHNVPTLSFTSQPFSRSRRARNWSLASRISKGAKVGTIIAAAAAATNEPTSATLLRLLTPPSTSIVSKSSSSASALSPSSSRHPNSAHTTLRGSSLNSSGPYFRHLGSSLRSHHRISNLRTARSLGTNRQSDRQNGNIDATILSPLSPSTNRNRNRTVRSSSVRGRQIESEPTSILSSSTTSNRAGSGHRPASSSDQGCDIVEGVETDLTNKPTRSWSPPLQQSIGSPVFTDAVLSRAVRNQTLTIDALVATVRAAGDARDNEAAMELISALGELAEWGGGSLSMNSLGSLWHAGARIPFLSDFRVASTRRANEPTDLPPVIVKIAADGVAATVSYTNAIVKAGGIEAILQILKFLASDDSELARRGSWALVALLKSSASTVVGPVIANGWHALASTLWRAHAADKNVLVAIAQVSAAVRRALGASTFTSSLLSGTAFPTSFLSILALASNELSCMRAIAHVVCGCFRERVEDREERDGGYHHRQQHQVITTPVQVKVQGAKKPLVVVTIANNTPVSPSTTISTNTTLRKPRGTSEYERVSHAPLHAISTLRRSENVTRMKGSATDIEETLDVALAVARRDEIKPHQTPPRPPPIPVYAIGGQRVGPVRHAGADWEGNLHSVVGLNMAMAGQSDKWAAVLLKNNIL